MIDKTKSSLSIWLEDNIVEAAITSEKVKRIEVRKWILGELEEPQSTSVLLIMGHNFDQKEQIEVTCCIVSEQALADLRAEIESYFDRLQKEADKSEKQ